MPNIPLAMTAVATLAETRVRLAKKVIGMRGSRVRDSTTTIATRAPTPMTSGQTTAGEPHEWRLAARNPSISASTPPVTRTAPGTSMRRLARSARLSETRPGMSAMATTAIGMFTKKIHRQLTKFTMTPEIRTPIVPPSPASPLQMPRARVRSRGSMNSRTTRARAAGDASASPAP